MVLKDNNEAITKHNSQFDFSKPFNPKKPLEPKWTVARKQEYMQSPEWKIVTKLVQDRDGGKCQACPTDWGMMHTHHLTYKRLGNEWLEDLTTLCPECHQAQHDHYGYSYETDYTPIIERIR